MITARDFSTFAGYPSLWPATTGAGGLKYPYGGSGSVFDPPFTIQAYTGVACKGGQAAYIGVQLDSVGADTPNTDVYPGVALPTYYADIVIGDTTQKLDNPNQNLFDNLVYGIYAVNSNVTSFNNAFINMDSREYMTYPYGVSVVGGDGIYANATNDATNHDRLRVYSPNGNPNNNWFYGFTNGVECYNYFHVICQNNRMLNASTGSADFSSTRGPSGICGFLLKSAKYDTVDISNDTISNVYTGIAFWALQDPMPLGGTCCVVPPWQYAGLVNITGNMIQANPLAYPTGTQQVQMGIAVQNVLAQSTIPVHAGDVAHTVNVNNNYLNDVYDGIYVNNFLRQAVISNQNNISVRPYRGQRLQYGINHTLCRGSEMYGNVITGDNALAASNDSMRAIYASSNTGIGIACNTESNMGRGYEFFLKNPGTAWHDNSMNGNIKGMILNGAIIGSQKYGGYVMNNQWLGTWGTGDTQTYVYHGANAIYDTLFVAAGGTTQPEINSGDPGALRYDYSTALGSIQVLTGAMRLHEPFCYSWLEYDTTQNNNNITLDEQITQQQILYPDNVIPNNWIGQFAIWENITADTTLLDSSTVLAVFASFAENSRYAYLTNMEAQLAQGNFESVETMLGYNIDSMANTSVDSISQVRMADGVDADFIVENYQQYYSLYMKYIEDTLSGSDSMAIFGLASLCPEINGTVVYQARALYSAVFNDLSIFNDDSCMDVDSTYSAERHANNNASVITNNGEQKYTLYPNPNNGNMAIKQFIVDANPVSMEITNIVGQSVYKENVLFGGGLANLQLGNLVPGMYLLQLKDSKNRVFKFKFVISKF